MHVHGLYPGQIESLSFSKLVAAFLSNALYEIARDQRIKKTIQSVLAENLAEFPGTTMANMIYAEHDEKIFVMARVHSPRTFSPMNVKRIQDRLGEALEAPTELIFRNTVATDVSAMGSVNQVTAQNLDGFFINTNPPRNVAETKIADTTVREFLADWIGYELLDVALLPMSEKNIVLATVVGFTPLSQTEIAVIEELLRVVSQRHPRFRPLSKKNKMEQCFI